MKYILTICLMLLVAYSVYSQEAVKAYAQGEDSFLLFSKEPYDASKNYTIVCFSQPGQVQDITATLKQFGTIVICEWLTAQDADKVLTPYNITTTVKAGRTLQLTGQEFSLNTTSPFAYLVLLDLKPQLLCCGIDCEKRLTTYFHPPASND